MLVSWTIFAFVVALIMLVVGKSENPKIKENKFLRIILAEKYVDFLLDISIVVVGIGLTIILTNYDTKQQEKETTISLLTSLKQELEIIENDLDENYISLYEKFALLEGEEIFAYYYSLVPVQESYALKIVMGNETAITNINRYSYVELIQLQSTLGIIYNRLGAIESLTSKDDIKGLISELTLLKERYAFMSRLLENEIAFQNGQILEKDMEQIVNTIHEEFLGVKE